MLATWTLLVTPKEQLLVLKIRGLAVTSERFVNLLWGSSEN